MQIHMKFQAYNDETNDEKLKYFQYIHHRLKDLGYRVKGEGYLSDLIETITGTINTGFQAILRESSQCFT